MIKLINGRLWYCCPMCSKKLFPISPDASCRGLYTKCRGCGWEGEVIIDKGA